MVYNITMNKYDLKDFVNTNTIEYTLSNLIFRIKKRRKEMKISQKDLARISGVTYASIRRFEETGDISIANLLKIANAFNKLDDFNYLFNEPIIMKIKDL